MRKRKDASPCWPDRLARFQACLVSGTRVVAAFLTCSRSTSNAF